MSENSPGFVIFGYLLTERNVISTVCSKMRPRAFVLLKFTAPTAAPTSTCQRENRRRPPSATLLVPGRPSRRFRGRTVRTLTSSNYFHKTIVSRRVLVRPTAPNDRTAAQLRSVRINTIALGYFVHSRF